MLATSGGSDVTKYAVLHKHPADGDWTEIERVDATSADAAIRAVAAATDGSGTFVAVPARSWRPKNVTLETKTRTVLS
jgi:hypothetical protein